MPVVRGANETDNHPASNPMNTPLRTPRQVSIDAREARAAWEAGFPVQYSNDRIEWRDALYEVVDELGELLSDPLIYWRPKPKEPTEFHGVPIPDWATQGAVCEDGEVVFTDGSITAGNHGWIRDNHRTKFLLTGFYTEVDNWYESQVTFRA